MSTYSNLHALHMSVKVHVRCQQSRDVQYIDVFAVMQYYSILNFTISYDD